MILDSEPNRHITIDDLVICSEEIERITQLQRNIDAIPAQVPNDGIISKTHKLEPRGSDGQDKEGFLDTSRQRNGSQSALNHDLKWQDKASKCAQKYMEEYGVRPKKEKIAILLSKEPSFHEMDPVIIGRRIRKQW